MGMRRIPARPQLVLRDALYAGAKTRMWFEFENHFAKRFCDT